MIIYGASGHGLVIKDILLRMGCDSVHFVDDADKPHWIGGQVVKPQSIEWNDKLPCVLGIGNNSIRQKLDLAITADFVKAIHPNSILAIGSDQIGAGTVIMAGVIVNTGTKVGRHAILNTSSSIDHECVIEDFVHVSPNATIMRQRIFFKYHNRPKNLPAWRLCIHGEGNHIPGSWVEKLEGSDYTEAWRYLLIELAR